MNNFDSYPSSKLLEYKELVGHTAPETYTGFFNDEDIEVQPSTLDTHFEGGPESGNDSAEIAEGIN
ncbi:MAG: hypothetical protein ACOH18_02500 [Candidatus Saccharimonadaceae bacterium]